MRWVWLTLEGGCGYIYRDGVSSSHDFVTRAHGSISPFIFVC